ncbi:hypothetical protein PPL_10846 [Heterostelium album PN500]|uniref:Uncharacterized protein n=1 Tax=Heterostelium pallidum (strain ATCC 26659 / Pp 5 / PN500) TaxID=670386 RepID=D3BS54_HETP5|nr:hypothetical protein PPL_10846 [Heterostelium album PN500]EFA75791.1 hypothetical protein PPL_10846 [Heterostelium album PN500]|eukprot:XP_020427925.1 hypothetical protein PPL_10846 [Heterostelium album PN500]
MKKLLNKIVGYYILKILCTHRSNGHQCKTLIGLIGAPGAGKSTICNIILYLLYGFKAEYFKTSDDHKSFTKGAMVMSESARSRISGKQINLEPLDMEGFDINEEHCWAMNMVMSTLCPVMMFCCRETRANFLYDALKVFKKGLVATKQFGLKPITKQIFIMTNFKPDIVIKCVNECKEILQDDSIEIIPFKFPTMPMEDESTSMDVILHPRLVEAIKVGVLDKISISNQLQSASSFSDYVKDLLKAFNSGNHIKTGEVVKKYFLDDCKRMIELEKCKKRIELQTTASSSLLTSVDTTLVQFIGTQSFTFTINVKSASCYNDK